MTTDVTDDLTAGIQAYADAEHRRCPQCSWCGHAGVPFEHNGVRFDGLTPCQGDRLCSRCTDRYLRNAPLLVLEKRTPDDPGVLYDLNPLTWEWSEKNIPGCRGEPPVRAIAAAYRPEYADYVPPERRRRGQA
jgi:hypothetical protein